MIECFSKFGSFFLFSLLAMGSWQDPSVAQVPELGVGLSDQGRAPTIAAESLAGEKRVKDAEKRAIAAEARAKAAEDRAEAAEARAKAAEERAAAAEKRVEAAEGQAKTSKPRARTTTRTRPKSMSKETKDRLDMLIDRQHLRDAGR
ncbi:MAG: hypothetical protein ACTSP0_02080 [Alphaproteobacteria bacterium]